MKKCCIFLMLIFIGAVSLFAQADKTPKPNMHRGFPGFAWGDEIALIMGKMKKDNPQRYSELEAMRKSDPHAFVQVIRPLLHKRSSNFKTFIAIDRDSKLLAEKIKNSKDEVEKQKLQVELKSKIKEGFDLMLKDTSERLEKLQLHIQALKENEDYVLEERYNRLIE